MPELFTILVRGEFALAESVAFGFGQRDAERFDGVMRLAFVLDGYTEQVGVVVRQDGSGVHGEVHGSAPTPEVRDQVARVLSLDHDGAPFAHVGDRDPVIHRLQQAAPGLRPPLFHSPYEAAAWSVLSARRPARQMAQVRDRLATAHGRVFSLAGRECAAFPTPAQLLAVESFPGVPTEHLTRLHGVARAAQHGHLDAHRLRGLDPAAASASLQQIRGLGPFYAMLIVVRGTGFADVLPVEEPRLRELVGRLYGLGAAATVAQLEEIGEGWRPRRTWAAVLIRAVADRLDAAEPQ